jgi:hypothetical protein
MPHRHTNINWLTYIYFKHLLQREAQRISAWGFRYRQGFGNLGVVWSLLMPAEKLLAAITRCATPAG